MQHFAKYAAFYQDFTGFYLSLAVLSFVFSWPLRPRVPCPESSVTCCTILNGKNVNYALCKSLRLGTARGSARRIPFEAIACARSELLHRLLVTL
jgi:hypothetical protein